MDSESGGEENDSFSSHFQNEEGYEWIPKEELEKNTNPINKHPNRHNHTVGAQYLSQQTFNQGIHAANIADLVYSQVASNLASKELVRLISDTSVTECGRTGGWTKGNYN